MNERLWIGSLCLVAGFGIGCDDGGALIEMDGGADAGPPPLALPSLWGPGAAEDLDPDPTVVEVSLRASLRRIDLGDGVAYRGMTYNGLTPGPVIHAAVGDELVVRFTNDLDQPTTIHWHGLRIPDDMDGNPRIQDPVEPGETFTYRFVLPEAGTYWYHPHVRTNEQAENGLYGPLVVRDRLDPEYDLERVLVLDDILLDEGSEMLPPFLGTHPEIMHGRYGNVLLTNGQVSELARDAATRGHVERWRIVNSANARTMELAVEGARWRVIAVDGGKLREPCETDRLIVPVGQRYDVEVSYDAPGEVRLASFVLTRNDLGNVVERSMSVFAVDVADGAVAPRSIHWPAIGALPERAVDEEVVVELDAVADPLHGTMFRINGMAHPTDPLFTWREGQTVRIRIANRIGMEHPFHLHGQFFEVLDGGSVPGPQPGLKDTVLVPGLETVEVRAYLDNPGSWMAHCHILAHAELGMMGEIVVAPAEAPTPAG